MTSHAYVAKKIHEIRLELLAATTKAKTAIVAKKMERLLNRMQERS